MGDSIGVANDDVSTTKTLTQPLFKTHQMTFDPRRTYKELNNGLK
jgi:hypothetical protein